jgi:hypothetical protein
MGRRLTGSTNRGVIVMRVAGAFSSLGARLGAGMAVALLVAACGSSSTSTPSTPPSLSPETSAGSSVAPASATPAASKGPATATFDLVGDTSLAGQMTASQIICGQPSLNGPQIQVLGKAGTSGPQIVLFIGAAHIEVRAATGAAASLRLRSFVGTGVTAFDAASGAQVSSSLTETTGTATPTGDIGTVTSISGTLDCGNEQPGVANVVVSGDSPQGTLSGALTSVHVLCTITSSGTFVGISGLAAPGTTPLLIFVTASTGLLQVAVETQSAGSFYTGKSAGIVTLVPGGAQIAGDVTESVTGGATAHVLHVAGDATCGTTVKQ